MENQIALAALARRRAEKAGRISQLRREFKKHEKELQKEVRNLDAVIRDMSGGEIDPTLIQSRKRFPEKLFERGAITKAVYDVLRPLPDGQAASARTFVDELMRQKGFDPDTDAELRNTLVNRTLNLLRSMWLRGDIEKVGKGHGVTWRLPELDEEAAAG